MNTYRAFIIAGVAAVAIIGAIVTLDISKVSIATQDYEPSCNVSPPPKFTLMFVNGFAPIF